MATLAPFAQAVRQVAALGGSILLSDDKVRVRVPTDTPRELLEPLEGHRVLLAYIALGRTGRPHPRLETGGTQHELGICDACGEPSMVAISRGRLRAGRWPTCRMTPGCPGRHVPVESEELRLARAAVSEVAP